MLYACQISSKTLRVLVGGIAILALVLMAIAWLATVGKLDYVGLTPASALYIGFIALLAMLGGLVFVIFMLKHGEKIQTATTSPVLDAIESKTLRAVIIGSGVLVCATFLWAGLFVAFQTKNSEITLPVVIIAGLVVLVMVLGLLTFVFSVLKLSDGKEALGLPSGSIRAVIALMLLVIFAIVAIFLYSDVSSNSKLQTLVVPSDQVAEIKKHVDYVADVDDKAGNRIVYYRSGSRAGEDLAKQLIVLLGTLVTAVSSFYFGSNSTAAAVRQATGAGGPSATTISPSNLKSGGDPQSVTIGGTNLSKVTAVKLVAAGKDSILADAGSIAASDTSVTCRIAIQDNADYGPWDVEVSDSANNFSSIPKSVTIGSKGSAGSNEIPLKADGKAQEFKLAATGLGKMTSLRLVQEGSYPISADRVEADQNGLTCTITVPTTAKPGAWVILLSDGAVESAFDQKKVRIDV